jgi:hypothetical protein
MSKPITPERLIGWEDAPDEVKDCLSAEPREPATKDIEFEAALDLNIWC